MLWDRDRPFIPKARGAILSGCPDHKWAAEADLRLTRLYDAIESGVADLDDPALKERIAGL